MFECEVAAGDFEHVELPEILMQIVGVRHCFLGYREEVEADVSAEGFYLILYIAKVVGEEI